jgi:NAD(P)-dependent dehydrogenase (short-subunit alcohol dehydrogenase family)
MVEGLAANGWTVAGCARSAGAMKDLAAAFPAPHHFAPLDVTDDAAVAEWVKAAAAATGVPDLLVNNAALINEPASLWEVPAAEFSEVIDVNIKGVANVIRHAVPLMIAEGRGVVVNFSSGWGRSTSPEVAPYCATKWAIEGLTQALSQELPRGMAAVALNPGVIDTDMLRIAWGEGASAYGSAADWGQRAVPFLEQLGPRDNGAAVTVP